MLSDIVIIDEPFIWIASMKRSSTIIELSKVTNQQHYLVGKDPARVEDYFQHLAEDEVRAIDSSAKANPYTRFGNMDLLLVHLN
jgi:hypothetical protein